VGGLALAISGCHRWANPLICPASGHGRLASAAGFSALSTTFCRAPPSDVFEAGEPQCTAPPSGAVPARSGAPGLAEWRRNRQAEATRSGGSRACKPCGGFARAFAEGGLVQGDQPPSQPADRRRGEWVAASPAWWGGALARRRLVSLPASNDEAISRRLTALP